MIRYWAIYIGWQVSIMAFAWTSGKLLGIIR
jgi:hypothetical protein